MGRRTALGVGRAGAAAVVAAAALVLVSPAPPGHSAPTQQPVKAKPPPVSEQNAATGGGYLTWDQNTRTHPHLVNEYFQRGGGPRLRVNPAGTQAFGGGVDGTTLVYQQVHAGRSGLRLYDLATRVRSKPFAGVNTADWEWHPTISGHWILFGRRDNVGATTIVLANTATHALRVLDSSTAAGSVDPGQVSGDWATWDHCGTRCNVFRYRISTRALVKLPNPLNRFQLASSVDSAGNVFYNRSGRRCGRGVRLMELPLGGAARTLLALHTLNDAGFSYVTGSGSGERLMFDKYRCSSATWDVYRIAVP